jgi:serine/threonine-protein kinase
VSSLEPTPPTTPSDPPSQPTFGLKTDFYTFSLEALAKELTQYDILREIGKGSMGIVYEARQRPDGERLALKVLPPSLTLTDRTIARFLREAEMVSHVSHPGIVAVYEIGRSGRVFFFAMEYIDGTALDQRVAAGPLPAREAAAIALQVADALHCAHSHGIVHRDIKPANMIQRPDGQVVVTDFGLARETGSGSVTESGALVGTPMYMAPEQVLGERKRIGTRTDVYGLGATLYELLTGIPPFTGNSAQAVLRDVLEREPR